MVDKYRNNYYLVLECLSNDNFTVTPYGKLESYYKYAVNIDIISSENELFYAMSHDGYLHLIDKYNFRTMTKDAKEILRTIASYI